MAVPTKLYMLWCCDRCTHRPAFTEFLVADHIMSPDFLGIEVAKLRDALYGETPNVLEEHPSKKRAPRILQENECRSHRDGHGHAGSARDIRLSKASLGLSKSGPPSAFHLR